MMQTQRKRWIRQQAALYKKHEEKDHYSSRSTTDSDSMEVITMAKDEKDTSKTMAKDEKDAVIPIVKNSITHKIQSMITKPHRGEEPEKIQNDHKCLEKGNEDIESEAESEKINTSSSHVPILP